MSTECQPPPARCILVAGPAGSGKSTLATALAVRRGLPLLDLDTLTNPLLDGLPASVLGEHWLAPAHGTAIRDARYAALTAVAAEVTATAGAAVLVAPFTAELAGGAAWDRLRAALGPADPVVVWIHGDAELLARRRAHRQAERDRHRPDTAAPPQPAVPHITVDAELTTEQQLFRVLRAAGERLPVPADAPLFDPAATPDFDAVLFDLDGTLADSTASVTRCWDRLAREFGAPAGLVQENHGQPADVLVGVLVGPDRQAAGRARIRELEITDAPSIDPIPGAHQFFSSVPEQRRAIVTSGVRDLATARLGAVGLPVPRTMVTFDDVEHGKPHPEPYLLAARRLGLDPARCLVFEDAPAGIASARAAGCRVVGVLGTSPAAELAGAELLVDGLDRLILVRQGEGLRLLPAN
ncbi:HAD-IA family hydrolase [Nakamurella sp.]|uniref:HAD-IA family hydrolase n=1 Tax=Nakamurella sp. TaxID=1869182 RepID=UPI003B3BCB8D